MKKPLRTRVRVNEKMLRHLTHAHSIEWKHTVPLVISYGSKPVIEATGVVVREFAEELREAGLLKSNRAGVYSLAIAKRRLSHEDVEAHIRKLEAYCVEHGHIPRLRGERLYLCDVLKPELKDRTASYDRNLDVLGFIVHSVGLVPYQCIGKNKDALVVAKRHPALIAVNGDSKWDVLSGAVAHGATTFSTMVSEGYDEFGLSPEQMRRARIVAVVSTNRTRQNPYSIVREVMQVGSLALTPREIGQLECHDVKDVIIVDDKTQQRETLRVRSNVGFIKVSPDRMMRRLRSRHFLKNQKALAVINHLLYAGHIGADDPYVKALRAGLRPKTKRYCVTRRRWMHKPVRSDATGQRAARSRAARHEVA